jgi:hypothetical protein
MDLPLYMGKEHFGQGERALNRAWELASSDPERATAFAAIAQAEFQAASASQVFGWHLPPRAPVDPKPDGPTRNADPEIVIRLAGAGRDSGGRFTKPAPSGLATTARIRAILSDMGVPDYPEPTIPGEA